MYDFVELEKKCKRYHRKKYLKYFVGFGIVVLGVIYYIFTMLETTQTVEKNSIHKNVVSQIPKQDLKPLPEKHLTNKPQSQQVVQKKPLKNKSNTQYQCYTMQMASYKKVTPLRLKWDIAYLEKKFDYKCYTRKLDIYDTVRCNTVTSLHELRPFIKTAKKYKRNYVILKEDCRYLQKLPPKKKTKIKVEKEKQKKTSLKRENLQLKEVSLSELQNLFQQRKSYQLALKIAQIYFEKKEYQQAYKWAKKANKIDRKDDKAWIILAKSKYNQGYKESAKKILKFYLNYYYSNDIVNLLKKWESK